MRSFHYWSGDSASAEIYPPLKDFLLKTAEAQGTGGAMLFYLATPPGLFYEDPPCWHAPAFCETSPAAFRRVIFEKPFGRDLQSARALNQTLAKILDEKQIYRIDHYLGKETVQNIMVIRFANGIFEPIWNRNYIDSVQITVSETLGVETSGLLLRPGGCASRHGPQPPFSAHLAHRHGATQFIFGR